jgi:hypothetical protein
MASLSLNQSLYILERKVCAYQNFHDVVDVLTETLIDERPSMMRSRLKFEREAFEAELAAIDREREVLLEIESGLSWQQRIKRYLGFPTY